jgi:hypothetical protein
LKILGLSASLRNKRFGRDADDLLYGLITLKDLPAVASYLGDQSRVQPVDLLDGAHDEADFEASYRRLRAAGRNQGLSNSESVTAVALWGAMGAGAEVSYRSLADHFPALGAPRLLDTLREEILTADGLLISSLPILNWQPAAPVNFSVVAQLGPSETVDKKRLWST